MAKVECKEPSNKEQQLYWQHCDRDEFYIMVDKRLYSLSDGSLLSLQEQRDYVSPLDNGSTVTITV